MKRISMVALATILAGCVSYQEVTTPPVSVQPMANFNAAALKSYDSTTFRSLVQPNVQAAPTEITGAKCVLRGAGYVAEFVTPAIVRIPNFGRPTPRASVSCEYNGKVNTKDVLISNLSAEQRMENMRNGTAQGGLLGAVIGETMAAAMDIGGDRAGDRYGYQEEIYLTFK